MMLRMRRETVSTEQQITPQIDNILVLDRMVDPLTPLLSQLTYEGLIDELFGIRDSEYVKMKILPICVCSSPHFPVFGARLVTYHIAVLLLLLLSSIFLCCCPFLSTFLLPLLLIGLSSDGPLILAVVFLVVCNVLASLSQLSSAIVSSFILTMCPAHFIRLFTVLPTIQDSNFFS